jgi:hypothetical protein
MLQWLSTVRLVVSLCIERAMQSTSPTGSNLGKVIALSVLGTLFGTVLSLSVSAMIAHWSSQHLPRCALLSFGLPVCSTAGSLGGCVGVLTLFPFPSARRFMIVGVALSSYFGWFTGSAAYFWSQGTLAPVWLVLVIAVHWAICTVIVVCLGWRSESAP